MPPANNLIMTVARFRFGDIQSKMQPACRPVNRESAAKAAKSLERMFNPPAIFILNRAAVSLMLKHISLKLIMKNLLNTVLASAIAFAVFVSAFAAPRCQADDKEPLMLNLPAPTLKGTPEDLPKAANIEPIPDKPLVFMVPKGVKNVALGKPVTASVTPFNGTLSQITDGKKEATDDDAVEMKKGVQWVQVDLGAPYDIYAIALWHDHRYVQVMHCVIVQVSDDPEFKTGVTTLFNNDKDNLAGQGAGTDREYFETNQGKVIDGKGTKARYVRGYTKGGTQGALNCWQEIEVYALPGK